MMTFTFIMVGVIFVVTVLALRKYRYNNKQEDLQIFELAKERKAKMQASGEKMISHEEMEEYFRQRNITTSNSLSTKRHKIVQDSDDVNEH